SIQFKMIEALLGLSYGQRQGQDYYISQLNEADRKRVKDAEAEESLLVLVNSWLERMPYVKDKQYWGDGSFWEQYRAVYKSSLLEVEMSNMELFDMLF